MYWPTDPKTSLPLRGDSFFLCLECNRQFYDGGRAAHHTHCSQYLAGEHTGGKDTCILVFGPEDIKVGQGGIWAEAVAQPNVVVCADDQTT